MKISKVTKCEVDECAHNWGNVCRAMGVTIGDERNPRCNAFYEFPKEAGKAHADRIACVDVCKVSSCMYNTGFTCHAAQVCVLCKAEQPECLTYQPICSAPGDSHEAFHQHHTALECQVPEIFVG
jgi:hypothetical protein